MELDVDAGERAGIIGAGLPIQDPVKFIELPAHQLAADLETLDRLKVQTRDVLRGTDALLLPTTTTTPVLPTLQADPVRVNSRLGTYTNFVNLLDMCGRRTRRNRRRQPIRRERHRSGLRRPSGDRHRRAADR